MFDEDSKKLMIELEVQMLGDFIGKNIEKEQFVEMIKYSETPQLSQLIRSYVITMTSVGELTPVRIPMINFVEFFKQEKKWLLMKTRKCKNNIICFLCERI